MSESASPREEHHAARARAVLPTIDDLFGIGWVPDEGEADAADGTASGLSTLTDQCLPADFPEQAAMAGDDVGYFRRGSAGLHGLSTVFASTDSASLAWSILQRDDYVACFVASLIAEAGLADATDVLGPVIHPAEVEDRRGVSVAVNHAELSSASADRVLPIVLRLASLLRGDVVVLVWSVDQGGSDSSRAWDHVITRVIDRCVGAS